MQKPNENSERFNPKKYEDFEYYPKHVKENKIQEYQIRVRDDEL